MFAPKGTTFTTKSPKAPDNESGEPFQIFNTRNVPPQNKIFLFVKAATHPLENLGRA
jgi:hypothetical protein